MERKDLPGSTQHIDDLLAVLFRLSTDGLARMYDRDAKLFCHKYKRTGHGMERETVSLTYTTMSLLGLHRFEGHTGRSPVDIGEAVRALDMPASRINNVGDAGLMAWLYAITAPEKLSGTSLERETRSLLDQGGKARADYTTELAWLLTGLTHAAMTSDGMRGSLEGLAAKVYGLLRKNYGGKGIFDHQNRSTAMGFLRGRIGSFADQVYPIYALSKFSGAFGNDEARTIALECAQTICRLQGRLGQWWWHYDANTAGIIGTYPVYSVHQHGMAPMALFAAREATGEDFSGPVYKGLEWITGKNELGLNLVDTDSGVVWRSFYRGRLKMLFEEAKAFAGPAAQGGREKKCEDLKVLYECRPYELGWFLYAFADKFEGRGEG